MKKFIYAVPALTALFLLSGCKNESLTQTGAEKTVEVKSTEQPEVSSVTFTDDLGREVTVTAHERTAALIGSFADIWITAGGEVSAAVNDAWDSLDLLLDDETVNLGSILQPDVEQLIASEPDFILASANTDADVELMDVFENSGIDTAYFSVSDFDEYLHMLDICTDITGRKDLYKEKGTDVGLEIDEILKRQDGSRPEVLFLRASSGNVRAKGSTGNVCGEMLKALGCENIADSDSGLLDELSMEAIIAADPEYIFITTQGSDQEAIMSNLESSVFNDAAWKSLTAVKENRYYMLDKRLFNLKPNSRWAEAYKILADILYAE